ncbi:hypothetical protein [Pelagicoccus albus]|uniref:Uncharacterized protein n=1 Tax=Pelagicoccus albus TaxID=415222 RepID=A0A7X1E8F5_9BACT|nr:hypothetical protein [Pelagicoccus albus]MBC2606304.1 hypothetical protein [Pelagicoccus albus]
MKILATEGLPTILTHYVPLPLLAFLIILTVTQLLIVFKNKNSRLSRLVLLLAFVQVSLGMIYVLQREQMNLKELLTLYVGEDEIPDFLIIGSIRNIVISASWCCGLSVVGPVAQLMRNFSNQSTHTTSANARLFQNEPSEIDDLRHGGQA